MSLLRLPPWIFGTIIVTAFMVLAIGGLYLFQRFAAGRLKLSEQINNQVVFFASIIAMFYSLTAGMIAVGVWTTYRQVENVVSSEATALGCLYRDIKAYPEPARSQLHEEIRSYVGFLIARSWPMQRRGMIPDEATRKLTRLEHLLVQFEPVTKGQQILHSQVLTQFNNIAGLRRQRLNAIGSGLPSVMWSVVLLGACLTIISTYFLEIDRKLHFIMTGVLSMFIGLIVFVIASLDRPISGPLSISPRPFEILLERLIDLN